MDTAVFGDGPRFSPVTSSDHAGQLWIVTILALIYSSLVSTARAYVKYKMFGIDDILIASATILQLAQSIAIFVGLGNGLGKFNSITTSDQWATSSKGARWAVITAIDIFTEVAAWLLIVELTWKVNMSVARKLQVIMAFSFRLPLIILSAVHLAYFNKYPSSDQPQFAIIDSLLFQQAMISWSLISATVPNLKNFLKSFSIGMGFPLAYDDTMSGSGGAYVLRSFANNRSKTNGSVAANDGVVSTTISARRHSNSELHRQAGRDWHGDHDSNKTTETQHYATSSRENVDEETSSRAGSQDMIINKEIVWKITYEDRP
ncbi:hypothetical protein NLG97_g1134 [Lecanicillium saksenae]|uniref:Uncharacterized protein n=1 Tax=Lecanicillium saksenae TaxID=468837 RepID=A0ACC1R7A5_9HYPO|nr:hypothetical protein NLG97_g1134 [Lecanicillium saksenae]